MAAQSPAWWLGREKNKTVLGTWNNDAFQVSLRDCGALEDPIGVPLLNEMLPYFCIPQCGVYGHEDYEIMEPLVAIHLPSVPVLLRESLYQCLPERLQAVLNGELESALASENCHAVKHVITAEIANHTNGKIHSIAVCSMLCSPIGCAYCPVVMASMNMHHSLIGIPCMLQDILYTTGYQGNQMVAVDAAKLDIFILVQSRPCYSHAVDANLFHINMLFHTWTFQGIDLTVDPEISDDLVMGIFGPNGVHEVAQDITEQLNGIPIGRTGKLAVYIHGGARFSPHNAQLGLQQDIQSVHSFFSFGYQQHSSRCVITYHVLCSNENAELQLKKCLIGCDNVGDLLDNFKTLSTNRPEFSAHLNTITELIECL